MGNVEASLTFELDYQFNKQYFGIGKILYMDFDSNSCYFVFSTILGWICVMNLQEKKLENKFRVINPDTKNPDPISFLKIRKNDNSLILYSKFSGSLYISEQKFK